MKNRATKIMRVRATDHVKVRERAKKLRMEMIDVVSIAVRDGLPVVNPKEPWR